MGPDGSLKSLVVLHKSPAFWPSDSLCNLEMLTVSLSHGQWLWSQSLPHRLSEPQFPRLSHDLPLRVVVKCTEAWTCSELGLAEPSLSKSGGLYLLEQPRGVQEAV